MKRDQASKRLFAGIALLVALSLCLCITTVALTYSIISVNNNIFKTGYVSINLNDGKPVIEDNEFIFEPGMTVEKEFFIKNNSTWNVYYKLYFVNVEGVLADQLKITISKEDKVLYSGLATELDSSVLAADDELAIGEKRMLKVTFKFPETAGNGAQGQELKFDLRADAVQTKNNPERLFN